MRRATAVEPFDPATLALDGTRLVEASAGTGKTFSLAGLYLRLVVERRLDVREILVMTFTRAATQELRERLRARLAMAARVAAEPARDHRADPAEHFAEAVIARVDEARDAVARRLRDAASRVDQATITTIHGFAQRAAGENAFESALPFDRGEQVDDAEVLREAAADYWRARVFGRPAQQAGAFVSLWDSPEALYKALEGVLRKPHARLIRPDPAAIERERREAVEAWPGVRDELVALLDRGVEQGAFYANDGLKGWLEAEGGEAVAAAIDAGLAGTLDGHPALPPLLADLGDDAGVAKHAKKAACKWFRPQDLEVMPLLARLQVSGRLAAATAAIDAIRALAAERKRERRLFSFDDMISALYRAVTDPDGGPALAAALRRTWPWALVDEFQDTDPLQYAILRTIYAAHDGKSDVGRMEAEPDHRAGNAMARQSPSGERAQGRARQSGSGTSDRPGFRSASSGLHGDPDASDPGPATPGGLVLIGDPKQAIYGFRGGDVFAYLDAAADARGRYGMDTNHRSSPAVIAGIGALFAAGGDDAFVLDGIAFRPVSAGREAGDRLIEHEGGEVPGVTAWAVPGDAGTAKGDLQKRIRSATVERIAALLDDGAIVADGERRAVHPSEIAVLVNSNREAAAMQAALDEASVPAVCIHQDSVFTHAAARDLLRVLRAAATPFDAERLRVALTTSLFGCRMGDLVALDADDRAWAETTERFQNAHVRWAQRGVQAMLEPLLQDAAGRIVGLADGDRRMTDCLHIAELLQRAEHEVFGMAGLVHWLEQAIRRADDGEVGDADRVRLADDSALVQVTTVHKAKGLQWPVVFVPCAPWLGTGGDSPLQPPLAFHDAHNRAVIDLGSAEAETHRPQAVRERRAEQVRSLYVALTRAEQACFFAHAAANNAVDGPLAWLLHRAGDDSVGVHAEDWLGGNGRKPPQWFDADVVAKRLGELEAASEGCLRVETLPEAAAVTRARPVTGPETIGTARTDFPAPWAPWSVFSYSRLAGRIAGHAEPAAGADDEGGDATTAPPDIVDDGSAPDEVATQPRGTGFGRAFHEVLETARFDTWPAPGEAVDETNLELVATRLRRNGVATADEDNRATPVEQTAAMIGHTLHAPLPGIGPLATIPVQQRQAEIEFFIRLGDAPATTLLERIAAAGYAGARGTTAIASLRGLMHGYIDLVVEHEGRYWILDYKTNALGRLRAHFAPERLGAAMAEHHYDLQYLVYSVALHRHLRQCLPDYDPATHLGGVLYLFVRGLDKEGVNGVYQDRPDPALVETLDALLDGREVA